MSRDNDQKWKNLLLWKCHVTRTKNDTFTSKEMQLNNQSSTLIHKNKSFFSPTSILSRSPMAYSTTASLDKLTCTDYVDFGKCQDIFERFSWSKKDSNYLDVRRKERWQPRIPICKNLTMGEAASNQFMRLRNQQVNAAENFAREENLTPVLIPTLSKGMDEQFKLAHNVADVVDRANRKICETLLWDNVDKPESFYAQIRLFARKNEDEMFQQVVYVNYKLEEFIYLIDVMNSVYDKVITNQRIFNVF